MVAITARNAWISALLVGAGLAICASGNAHAQAMDELCGQAGQGAGCLQPFQSAPSTQPPPVQPSSAPAYNTPGPAPLNAVQNAEMNAALSGEQAIVNGAVQSLFAPPPPPPPRIVPVAPDSGTDGIRLDQLGQRSEADLLRQQEDARIRQQADDTKQQRAAVTVICNAQAKLNDDNARLNTPLQDGTPEASEVKQTIAEDQARVSEAKLFWANVAGSAPYPACITAAVRYKKLDPDCSGLCTMVPTTEPGGIALNSEDVTAGRYRKLDPNCSGLCTMVPATPPADAVNDPKPCSGLCTTPSN